MYKYCPVCLRYVKVFREFLTHDNIFIRHNKAQDTECEMSLHDSRPARRPRKSLKAAKKR